MGGRRATQEVARRPCAESLYCTVPSRQLSEQLRVKDVQIAEKDKQLDQQQQLTLQAMNDRDTLKLELEQVNEKVQEQESKGFWARVFRR